jgi:hypothetical protein
VSPEIVARTAKSVSVANQNEAIASFRLGSAGSRPASFCADCELDHIRPRTTGAMWTSPDGASQFQIRGLARSLGVILRWRPCFFPHGSLIQVQAGRPIWQRHRSATQAIAPLPHTVATITTRILSRALQPVILTRSDKAQLLAAAANTLQPAIDYPVFSIDGGIITCRAILRPRRADRRG